MDEILSAFVEDGHELLAAMEAGLLRLEEGERDDDTLNAIFRAAHTIKGDAGVVELHEIEGFTHVLENYLDLVRKGTMAIDGELVTLLLEGCDHIKALIFRVESGLPEAEPALEAEGGAIVERLRRLVAPAASDWHLSVCFHRGLFRKRLDPLDFLRYLASLGEIAHIAPRIELIPDAAEMDPESCYLGFEIDFRGSADQGAIEKVFEFARDDCDLVVSPRQVSIDECIRHIENLPAEPMRLGDILVKSEALTPADLEAGLDRQQETGGPASAREAHPRHLGAVLIEQRLVAPEIVEAAARKQRQVTDQRAVEARQIRVQADKLDQLVDMVGELVISTAAASTQAQRSKQALLVEANAAVARMVESIRELSLQLRMVQIGETFGRFRRVVRDVAREEGREIELLIRGEETELDKTVVEKIGDPLVHLVRNALDHGIESAAERIAHGKPARGRIELHAYHDAGGVVIEVADDGAGLDQEKILAKAIERGVVQEGQALSEREIFNLIFEAGFSTADKVTNVSGRGVGMDVVRSNVQALRGTVEVQSETGQGSRFIIRLPLTMAIIDGFLVGVGGAVYVVPLDRVVECTELPEDSRDRNYLNLRGEVLSCIRLRELFALRGERTKRENVVVVRHGDKKICIVVDELLGEFQTVIKPLTSLFRRLRGVAGATILGNGEVALILDVQGLTQWSMDAENPVVKLDAAVRAKGS